MSTLFQDDFNRADSATVSATNWAENESGGTAAIASNRLSLTGTGGSTYVSTTTTAHAAIADCKATATRISSTSFDSGPLVRKQSGADTFYYLDVITGASSHSVFRRVAGADTDLGTRSFTGAANDTYSLQVSGSGATVTLKVFKNGVQQGADYSDTNAARITGAGQTGILGWGSSGLWDDFIAEDLVTQDTPELRGRPGGLRGQRQQVQLLAF